jgi:hypothetical protein
MVYFIIEKINNGVARPPKPLIKEEDEDHEEFVTQMCCGVELHGNHRDLLLGFLYRKQYQNDHHGLR